MGLSRNKVAVSEGAAGSPPFYGERGLRHVNICSEVVRSREKTNKNGTGRVALAQRKAELLFNCQDSIKDSEKIKRKDPKIRGCSSAGRAPALQAGGQGFDSLHLHHYQREATMWLAFDKNRLKPNSHE